MLSVNCSDYYFCSAYFKKDLKRNTGVWTNSVMLGSDSVKNPGPCPLPDSGILLTGCPQSHLSGHRLEQGDKLDMDPTVSRKLEEDTGEKLTIGLGGYRLLRWPQGPTIPGPSLAP